jgi:ElaB/YqjD/DUF883 family membrane-anchored ribosome-binding protein
MLTEIYCDRFIEDGVVRPKIEFHQGLNTVLGDVEANNSIGKTTFLLIVDYAFGGEDYAKSDAARHILNHTICFAFEFGGQRFYFSRSTLEPTSVNKCNAEYETQSTMLLKEYNEFLFEKYRINRTGLTFRNAVGRYLRIYGRDNLNETRPLNNAASESSANAIMALLKLFGRYDRFDELMTLKKTTEDNRKALAGAIEFDYVPAIKNKTKYKENLKQIDALEAELKELLDKEDEALSQTDMEHADAASEIKARLAYARRQRSRLVTQQKVVEANMQKQIAPTADDIAALQEFFPGANIAHINDIERFHYQLQGILVAEFEEEKAGLQALFNSTSREILELENKHRALGIPAKLSKPFLDKYSSLNSRIGFLQKQNASYDELNDIKEKKKQVGGQLEEVEEQELRELQNDINVHMAELNNFIYDNAHKPPILDLQSTSQYVFETPDDTGTGTNYKSMIVFDLSVLAMTPLPAVAHESIILKNIGDAPLEKIMELYMNTDKQVFIALDKDNTYSRRTSEILNQTAVLRLSENGKQLFGRSWNTIDN